MGYLLAPAVMLYGRREDRLSHVLVHPPDLEGTDGKALDGEDGEPPESKEPSSCILVERNAQP